mgnify:CR=1 FL=1
MDRDRALGKLRSIEQMLRAEGVCGLHLFGSHGRGDANEASDIDLMFDIAPDARLSLFDQARLARQLGDLLGASVDFVPRRSLHPLVRKRAEAERVTIFE